MGNEISYPLKPFLIELVGRRKCDRTRLLFLGVLLFYSILFTTVLNGAWAVPRLEMLISAL